MVKSKKQLSLSATVTNNGPSPSSSANLRYALSGDGLDGVEVVSATTSAGSCQFSSGEVNCDVGALAAGAEATVNVVVRPRGTGTLLSQVSVQSAAPDPSEWNNIASTSTRVSGNGR